MNRPMDTVRRRKTGALTTLEMEDLLKRLVDTELLRSEVLRLAESRPG